MLLNEFELPSKPPRYLDLKVSIRLFNRFYAELLRKAKTDRLKRIGVESPTMVVSANGAVHDDDEYLDDDEPYVQEGYVFRNFKGFPSLKVFLWDCTDPNVSASPMTYRDDWSDFHTGGMIEFPSYDLPLANRDEIVQCIMAERTYLAHEFTHYLQWVDGSGLWDEIEYDEYDHPREVEAYTHQLAVDLMWEVTHSKTVGEAVEKLKRLGWNRSLKAFRHNIQSNPRGILALFMREGPMSFHRKFKIYREYFDQRIALIHQHVTRALAELASRTAARADRPARGPAR
jgi:hypothetical protein